MTGWTLMLKFVSRSLMTNLSLLSLDFCKSQTWYGLERKSLNLACASCGLVNLLFFFFSQGFRSKYNFILDNPSLSDSPLEQVAFELYSAQNAEYFIRVLWSGQPMQTSTPLGVLDMVPLADLFSCTFVSDYVQDIANQILSKQTSTRWLVVATSYMNRATNNIHYPKYVLVQSNIYKYREKFEILDVARLVRHIGRTRNGFSIQVEWNHSFRCDFGVSRKTWGDNSSCLWLINGLWHERNPWLARFRSIPLLHSGHRRLFPNRVEIKED